jgi:putative membrane protein
LKKIKINFISVVLGCYILYLSVLVHTGQIQRFINPRLTPLTLLAIIILAAMLIYNLKTGSSGAESHEHSHNHSGSCECHHGNPEKSGRSNYILLLPILLSMIIPVQNPRSNLPANSRPKSADNLSYSAPPTSSDTYVITGSAANDKRVPTPPAQQSETPAIAEYTQLMIGNILFDTLKAPKEKMLNSKIRLVGKVFRGNLFKPDEIVLYRVVITCCAADGVPAGVLVKLPAKNDFNNEEWVGVEGTISLRPFPKRLGVIDALTTMVTPEKQFAYFTAVKAYRIDPPDNEYLFP